METGSTLRFRLLGASCQYNKRCVVGVRTGFWEDPSSIPYYEEASLGLGASGNLAFCLALVISTPLTSFRCRRAALKHNINPTP